ncbi:DUF1934 domain-containing protein [Weissella coleopterorum]|uniref:DUF1934 domain-containing protein n=1 Tax=Weissella coleopterorum TaxID=2714949 RepID=A0A6G8AYU0_9LACO|nr:DUF1934 domain-containing protein [Weissella coleopterorum]QIL50261.1 DUF1934 domain-containing protein [Weissella coleopterorum]
MLQKITIMLTNTIQQADTTEVFTFDEPGTLSVINDHTYLRFTETAPVKTPVTVKINPDHTLMITRNGQSKLQLTLNPTIPTVTHYHTPLGVINMTVQTDQTIIHLDQGIIWARYTLYQGDDLVGQYTFDLNFK